MFVCREIRQDQVNAIAAAAAYHDLMLHSIYVDSGTLSVCNNADNLTGHQCTISLIIEHLDYSTHIV